MVHTVQTEIAAAAVREDSDMVGRHTRTHTHARTYARTHANIMMIMDNAFNT